MKTQSMLLAALASAPAAFAHTVFTDFYVDGQPQGDGVAMRMNPDPSVAGSPIASLDSKDMACNVGGTKGVSRVESVPDGALLTFEIRSWADDPTKERLDRGHKGPCAVYLKKVDSAIKDQGAGDGWFKIFEHGYDASTKRWCTDEIIDNKGLLSVNVPKGLEGGSYLARPEILALHAANSGDPQFYTGCAQIFLQSKGDLVPAETVSIPGYVKYGQPATSFDIYNTDNAKYTLPGPPIAKLTPRAAQFGTASTTLTQSEGLKPEGCLVENANWCGVEVPSYSDEKGCWAAGENCWAQSKVCYSSAPPTGNAGCELWAKKCKEIQNACTAKNFNGPPNKGKVLTAEKKKIDVGLIMDNAGNQVVDSPAPAPQSSAKQDAPAKQSPAPKPQTNDNNDKDDDNNKPSPSPSKATPTPAPKPSSNPPSYNNNDDKKEAAPKPASSFSTITVAPAAPSPSPAGQTCPQGWKCITEVEVVTQTVYITASHNDGDDGRYKRSGGVRMRLRKRLA